LLVEATQTNKAAWTALADLYAIAGDVRKALDALDQAIAASPTVREDWLFSRADFLLVLGNIEEAEKVLPSIDVPAHRALLEARIASARGDLDAAIDKFEEGIRLWPDNPDARYLAARAYERKGDWKQAAAHYREAARMEPPHYESSLALASLQRALGDQEGVSFLLVRLAESHPNDPKIIEKLIEHAADSNNTELGRNAITRLSRVRGQAGRAVALAAARVDAVEGPEAALAAIEKSGLELTAVPNVEALAARIDLLNELEREDEAIASIEAALAVAPKSARLHVLRASVHQAAGRVDRAIADLEKACELDPGDLPALLALANAQREAGRIEVAHQLYEKAVQIEVEQAKQDDSSDWKASVALARLDLETGETKVARDRLRKVLDANPRQGEAAWLLLKSFGDGASGSGLAEADRTDLALRAAVFQGSPEAQDYWKRLNAAKS
jgi:tetratricopeptide (TPR) repeat protein